MEPAASDSVSYFVAAMKARRKNLRLTQLQLAESVGASVVTINQIEGLKRYDPEIKTLERIAAGLNSNMRDMILEGMKLIMKSDYSGRHIVAQNLRLIRARRNLTLAKTAELSGLSLSTIAGIEAARKSTGVDVLYRVAQALDVSLADLCVEYDGNINAK